MIRKQAGAILLSPTVNLPAKQKRPSSVTRNSVLTAGGPPLYLYASGKF
jgi:hypothetical protein